ncbi:MAG: hypothetical protein M3R24_11590, partial [Chloroflexota bacterium]|nr:hypothetical protein [Chloroflexota bacterium]
MRNLPPALRHYILFIYGCGLVTIALCFITQPTVTAPLLSISLFVLLATLTEFKNISYTQSYSQTVTTAIMVAAAFLFDPVSVVLIAILPTVIADLQIRKPWYKMCFNIGYRVILYAPLSISLYTFNVKVINITNLNETMLIVFSFIGYMFLSTFILGMLFTLAKGKNIHDGWYEILKIFNPYELALFPYGLVLAWLWHINPWYFGIGLLPLAAIQHAFAVHAGLLKEQEASMRLTTQQRQIHEATTSLLSSTDIHSQLDTMMKYIMEVFPVSRASVLLWGEGSEPDQVVSRGTSSPDLPIKDWGENLRRVSESRRLVQL